MAAMRTRESRLGENEAFYREVNERIAEVAGHLFDEGDEPIKFQFVCECASATCTEQLALSLEEYASVRSDARWFFLVPGHELPAIERVIDRRAGYLVVEKTDPDAKEAALATLARLRSSPFAPGYVGSNSTMSFGRPHTRQPTALTLRHQTPGTSRAVPAAYSRYSSPNARVSAVSSTLIRGICPTSAIVSRAKAPTQLPIASPRPKYDRRLPA